MQPGAGRGKSDERTETVRRGWSALLALVLVLVGAGLGAPRPATVAAPAHAGAGHPADGRDALPARALPRPAILVQRTDDLPGAVAAPEPLLGPPSFVPFRRDAAAATVSPHAAPATPAGPSRPYHARAPPAHA